MQKGITVRAEKLSDLLSPFGKFSGTDRILVSSRSEVFSLARGEKAVKLGMSTPLGALVRERSVQAPQVKLVPVEGKEDTYDLVPVQPEG